MRLAFLLLGVVIGLTLGVIPGFGGLSGLAILIPFTYAMDPISAIATLIGMLSVTTISDTIPAVFFAVPGTTGSQATILDGHPMARNGEAGRALGAAYASSMIGGVFGAVFLTASVPVVRPILSMVESPELFMLGALGMSMVSVLSGRAPVRGAVAALIGLSVGLVGLDPFRALPRWHFGTMYLRDGVGLVPLSLGLFAIPEVMDLAIRGTRIADTVTRQATGVVRGMRDSLGHWFLVLRSSAIGSGLGAIPGIGVTVIDWFAYGHALQTERGARETFGKGDIRGVIAPESANNAKEGGSLIPTLAFGIPGSASMALLLGALLIHGFQPGREMLTADLAATYVIIWSLALATVMGTGIALLLSTPLSKLAIVPIHYLVPGVVVMVFLAAFQESRRVGDLYVLLACSALGWTMKRFGWPRPPLLLGYVLASLLERFLSISMSIYGAGWLLRPGVVILFVLIVGTLMYGLLPRRGVRSE